AELQIGIMGSEVHTRTRLAGLDNDRTALRRRQSRQRPPHAIIFTFEIQNMHLFRNAEDALFAVEHDGVGLDAVPQSATDAQMLLRALIAYVVLDHLLVAVVCCLVLRAR